MELSKAQTRQVAKIAPFLVALMVTGCADFKPYVPRDDREEGPKQGLFSGAEGGFVIYRSAGAPDAGKAENKSELKNGE